MPDDFMEIYRQLCQKVEADINLNPHDAFLRIWSRPKILDPIGYHVLTANLFRYVTWLGRAYWKNYCSSGCRIYAKMPLHCYLPE